MENFTYGELSEYSSVIISNYEPEYETKIKNMMTSYVDILRSREERLKEEPPRKRVKKDGKLIKNPRRSQRRIRSLKKCP